MNETPPQVLETCRACGQLLDVSDLGPFSEIDCPNCGESQRVRTKFHHFELVEFLGEGGMGSVFRATDLNLQRQVALKILKRHAGGQEPDYKKLAEEARITASINHPHVVKVFSFGDDHGLFYLAMELVPKGSLDDLMGLQGRVGELQALNTGIQVAQGLQAALERGLLHRDVKPGNILFADANTAKIVDFGLAMLLDEQAQEQGEIWGTPYYIAPEKLDNRPEDFRSDMYSLGGTLFHAIAGRPPFEASTASMVALKHVKSQAVSLQAFAPDVSSETAYVINRMLHKDPDGRYASYDELLGHLNYAKQKLLERSQSPIKNKERGIVESEESRKVMGIIWGVTLLVLIAAGALTFVFKDQIFQSNGSASNHATEFSPRELEAMMQRGRNALAAGDFAQAIGTFSNVADATARQPTRNWAIANKGLALLFEGNSMDAADTFMVLKTSGLFSKAADEQRLANFFVEMGRLVSASAPIAAGTIRVYSKTDYDAFAMLAYGLKDWNVGAVDDAGLMLEAFDESNPRPPYDWISSYKPIIQPYLVDFRTYRRLADRANKVPPDKKAAILAEIEAAKVESTTGSVIVEAYSGLADKLNAANP
jgi:serine/threonine protein kinase